VAQKELSHAIDLLKLDQTGQQRNKKQDQAQNIARQRNAQAAVEKISQEDKQQQERQLTQGFHDEEPESASG